VDDCISANIDTGVVDLSVFEIKTAYEITDGDLICGYLCTEL
jgi:hypothetical protein